MRKGATDGLLSNTAMLLAALYAWYRSRMDAPAQQPRNYDLTTYVPRQRMLDVDWSQTRHPYSGDFRFKGICKLCNLPEAHKIHQKK
jgi:hypothetical protein